MCAVKAGARPGTLMRGRMGHAFASRGHGISALWSTYSSKAASDVVLLSDVEYGHFLNAESDPNVQNIDYAPKKRVANIGGEDIATIVDAIVTLRSGAVVWREIKASEDVRDGANTRANLQILVQQKIAGLERVSHEVWTPHQIYAKPQLIQNWHRIVAWFAQAREHPLPPYSAIVERYVRGKRRATFGEISELGPPELEGLHGAALFRLVQYGFLSSDLDVKPLSTLSQFFLPEVPL